MAFSEFEIKRHQKILDAFREEYGPPPHTQEQLSWGYRIKDQTRWATQRRQSNLRSLYRHRLLKIGDAHIKPEIRFYQVQM